MTSDIIKKAEAHNGKFAVVTYRRPVEPKKRGSLNGRNVEKMSKTTIRIGLDYNNQAAVIEKHASGEVQKKGLPASMQKISRTHYRNAITGDDMLGCVPVNAVIRETKFFVDGVETPLEQIENDLPVSAFKSSGEKPDWMLLKVKHIVELNPLT